MVRSTLYTLLVTVFLLTPNGINAQTSGPSNGSLVIVGGAMRDPGIMQRFMDLAGGNDAPIVVIPTAGGEEDYDQFYSGLKSWRDLGATNMTVLHTKDRSVADSEAFCNCPSGSKRSLVSRRTSVASGRFLFRHKNRRRTLESTGTRWCHRRFICRGQYPRLIPGPWRHAD